MGEAPTYRPFARTYEATRDIPVAKAGTMANPHLGPGGLDQMYVPGVKKLISSGALRYLPDRDVVLTNLRSNLEDPRFAHVNPWLPESPLTVQGARVTGGLMGGTAGAGTAVMSDAGSDRAR